MNKDITTPKKRFAIYARADPSQPRRILDRQISNCVAQVNSEFGTVVSVHVEYACGGTAKERPEMQAALEIIEGGEIDVLVCESLDRICRTSEDYTMIHERLEQHGVQIHTVGGGAGDDRTQQIAAILSQHLAADMGSRIRRGKALAKALRS